MLYRKNITRPESLLRVVGGIALIAAGRAVLAERQARRTPELAVSGQVQTGFGVAD